MYEETYSLSTRPFTSTPFVRHYFAAQAMQQSLASCRLSIDRGSGPVVIVGEPGTGKSLLLAMLEEQYRPHFSVVNLACGRLVERQELLQSILFELQLPYRGMSEGELRLSLMDYLKPSQACPNGVLLLVDEAHYLPVELLDEVRLITNYVRDGQPRVRLVMSGSQALEERLNDPKLDSFNQRIAARCFLSNLSQSESADYVMAHVDRAGGHGNQLFERSALRVVHELTNGCPRFINQLCEHAMILGSTRGAHSICENLVRESWADVQNLPGTFIRSRDAESSKTGGGSNHSAGGLKENESWTVIEFGSLDDGETEAPASEAKDFRDVDPKPAALAQDSLSRENLSDNQEIETGQADSVKLNDDFENESSGETSCVSDSDPECDKKCGSGSPTDCQSNDEDGLAYDVDTRRVETISDEQSESPAPQIEVGGCGAQQESPTWGDQRGYVDPFAEEFAEEELISDRYNPLVALQNHNSARLTPAELGYLQPLEIRDNHSSILLDSDVEPNEDDANEGASNLFAPERFAEEDETTNASAIESPVDEAAETQSETRYHTHVSDVGSAEIERRAEEIMRAINVAEDEYDESIKTGKTVSCGTPEELESVDSPTIEFRQKDPASSSDSIVNDDGSSTESSFGAEGDVGENQCLDDEGAETHRLLKDIIEEKNRAAACAFAEPDSRTIPLASEQSSESALVDDRDLIVVGRQDHVSSDQPESGEPLTLPSTPVSTGQAKRMDYQQLFEQLRSSKDH
jgi:type II secretory pathway predicted ATPase ExeA